jgi:hypothetical protein
LSGKKIVVVTEEDGDDVESQRAVARELSGKEILKEMHESPTRGDCGIKKT